MDIFSHILWTYLPFRKKSWCGLAILFAILPDTGYLLIMLYGEFGVVNINMDFVPGPFMALYHLLHSFFTLAFVALILYVYRPNWLPALSGWLLHILIDIPTHQGDFGTRFLYPALPDFYFEGISWSNFEVLAAGYSLLLLANIIYLIWEHRQFPDKSVLSRAGRFITYAGGLINNQIIPASNAASGDFQGASGELSGKDQNSTGQGEDQPPRAIIPQKAS